MIRLVVAAVRRLLAVARCEECGVRVRSEGICDDCAREGYDAHVAESEVRS